MCSLSRVNHHLSYFICCIKLFLKSFNYCCPAILTACDLLYKYVHMERVRSMHMYLNAGMHENMQHNIFFIQSKAKGPTLLIAMQRLVFFRKVILWIISLCGLHERLFTITFKKPHSKNICSLRLQILLWLLFHIICSFHFSPI